MRGGALGDFIVTLPLLRTLWRGGWQLNLVGNAPVARALAPRLFEHVQSIDDPAWSGLFDTAADIPPMRGRALVLWKDRAVADRLPGAAHWPPYPPPDSTLHVAEHLLGAGTALDASPAEDALREVLLPVAIPPDGRQRVLIHPGSGSRRKNWPAERWATVAAALAGRGHEVAIVAGEADDRALADLRARGCAAPAFTSRPLGELASLLAGAGLYLGNDSGVSHLAGAVGAPTVAVFGPTRALRWAPLGPRVIAVEPPRRCARCQVAEAQPVDCRCLEQIEVDAVLSAADWLVV